MKSFACAYAGEANPKKPDSVIVDTPFSLLLRLDPLSAALLGLATGLLLAPILFALYTGRLRRRLLRTELGLEQCIRENSRQEELTQRLRRERDELRQAYEGLGRDNGALRARCSGLEDLLEERDLLLEATQRQIEQRFEFLASDILTEKSSLINQQHESTLKLLLSPFQKQLQEFHRRIDDVYDREARDRVAMIKEIEQLRQLNLRLSNDAVNLTEALQGKNKLQGQWGEMILEKILEESGLRKGREYSPQASLQTTSGSRRQPDVIVHLPQQRDVIIDAKVSLKAYTFAHTEQDQQQRKRLIDRHLSSINKHISSLSGKHYHQLEGANSLEFVLLFIPIEGAFQMALEHDATLLTRATRKQIVLCSPSTLLAILRTIHHLWRIDDQHRNGLIIAKQAGNLYDKFVGFVQTFEQIGVRLDQSQQAWSLAKKRLSSGQGNLILRAERLKELGIQTERELADALKESPATQGEKQ